MNHPDRTKSPEVRPFDHLYIVDETAENLPNGIRFHSVISGTEPVCRIIVLWRYGISDKPYTYASRILPQLMIEGTKKKSGEEIADEIDFQGAWLVPRSDDYFCGFELISLNKSIPSLLTILRDIILYPTLDENQFEALRQKALAGYLLNLQRTSFLATRKLESLMAGVNHHYHSTEIQKMIEGLTIENVRTAWETAVHRCPIDIFVGGQPDGNIIQQIKDFSMSLRDNIPTLVSDGYIPCTPDKPSTEIIEVEDARQASIALGIPTINRNHPDYVPLRMTVIALGGYFGSRLMMNIREKQGLTYGINAALLGVRQDAYVKITADCDPSYIEKVLDAIEKEVVLLATVPIDTEELIRLKMYLGTIFASTLDSPFAIEDYYVTQLTVGSPADYFEQQQTELSHLDSETIMKMASRYLLPFNRASIVIARPK